MCIIQFIYIYIYVYYMKETIQKVQFCIIKIYCFKFYYMYNGFINACIKAKPFSFSIDALNYIFIYATDLFSYNFSIYVWVFLIVNSYIHKSKYNIDDFFCFCIVILESHFITTALSLLDNLNFMHLNRTKTYYKAV